MADGVRRREFLSVGAATLAAGCTPCSTLKPLSSSDRRLAIGDAHVHLFNAADLPVTGFFLNVVIPGDLGNVPEIGAAILDIATRVLKFLSRTARDELATMRSPWSREIEDVSAETFAGRIKMLGEEAMAARGFVKESERDPLNDLGDSYYALAELLSAAQNGATPAALDEAGQKQRYDAVAHIDQAFLARVARDGAAAAPADNLKLLANGFDPAFILSLIRWAFLMVQSRCSHVHRYLREMDSSTTRTTAIINLLVDYDAWLGDRPKTGSEPERQVRFWTYYARAAAPRVGIHSFAGYDPLAHAQELIDGTSGYWETRRAWALAGSDDELKVTGFKLYPPMGFNVDANGPLPDVGRATAIVRDNWNAAKRDLGRFKQGLDDALDIFFEDCVANDIPMLAHGRNSEESYSGAGAGADLQFWARRAARIAPVASAKRLRAIVAHYSGWEFSWAVGLPQLLRLNAEKRSEIYVDIAYCTDLLKSEKAAIDMLDEIGRLCAKQPDGDDWVVFGSDWIMLAQQPGHERYIAMIEAAIAGSRYWNASGRREKLLGGNLRRFLRSPA